MAAHPDGCECEEPSAEIMREIRAAGWGMLKIGGSVLAVTSTGLVEIAGSVPPEFVLLPRK
jgi:hypothetical protein